MKKYVISLSIVVLSCTNAVAADWSSLSIERNDLEIYNLINCPTSQLASTKADERSNTVDYTKSISVMLAKFAPPERGNPDTQGDNQGGGQR